MTLKQIASRFPNLSVGEVIYVCSNGVSFNKGTESDRRKLARAYSFSKGLVAPEKVEKKAKKSKASSKENND